MLRPGVPLRCPTDVDSRRFPGWLKLNLGVRIARYARLAAAAKTMADVPNAPDGTGNGCENSPYNSRSKPVNLKR